MTKYHLRDDITPEQFVHAVRMCNSPIAPYYDKDTAQTRAVRALFREVEPETKQSAELAGPAMPTGGTPAAEDTEHRTPIGTQGTEPAAPTPPAESGETVAEENATAISAALLSMEEYVRVERSALLALVRTTRSLRATVERLEGENDQLRQDRYDALSVTSRDGLLASEWVARTGKAERERDALRAEVARLREDGERMDWLQSLASYQTFPDGGSITHFATKDVHAALHASGGNLRAAIDAARSTPEGDNG